MGTLTPVTNIKGWRPALDPRKLGEPSVIDGKNFLIDAEGPYTPFGTEYITYDHIIDPTLAETFRVGSNVFVFTTEAVFAYDPVGGEYYPTFTFTPSSILWPWSSAEVGGKYYFARKGIALLEYNPITNAWAELTTNVPAGPVAVIESSSRLVVLGADAYAWSAIDDGADLRPSVDTGAVLQSLSIANNGDPLGLLHTADGFIVYTTKGLVKAEATGLPNPYRSYHMSEHHIPISQYCITDMAESRHVFLTKNGFFTTEGGVPKEWQPLMSEYFRRKVLKNFNLTTPALIRFYYNADRQWLFVSIAELSQPTIYTKAWVLYVPMDEWGSFDITHSGFGELNITIDPLSGFDFGYLGTTGCMHQIVDTPHREIEPIFNDVYAYHPDFEIPARLQNAIAVGTSQIKFLETDESQFAGQAAGLFNKIVDTPYTPLYQGLDARIDVGLFRLTEQVAPGELSTITEVWIGSLDSPEGQTAEDYNEVSEVTEDWNLLSGDEDWGSQVFDTVVYDAEIIGTIDGVAVWESQQETLEVRETIGKTKIFTCYNNGLYHIIRMKAENEGESFYIKTFELGGFLSGIYS